MFQVFCAVLVAAAAACLCSAQDVAVRQQLMVFQMELYFDETVSVEDVNTTYVLEVLGKSGYSCTAEYNFLKEAVIMTINVSGWAEHEEIKEVVQSFKEQSGDCDAGVLCHVTKTPGKAYAISNYKVYVEFGGKLEYTNELYQQCNEFIQPYKVNNLNYGFEHVDDDDYRLVAMIFTFSDLGTAVAVVKEFNKLAQSSQCDAKLLCYAVHAEIIEAFPSLPSSIWDSSSDKSDAQMLSVTCGALLCLLGLVVA